jgi:hypothetical protein
VLHLTFAEIAILAITRVAWKFPNWGLKIMLLAWVVRRFRNSPDGEIPQWLTERAFDQPSLLGLSTFAVRRVRGPHTSRVDQLDPNIHQATGSEQLEHAINRSCE